MNDSAANGVLRFGSGKAGRRVGESRLLPGRVRFPGGQGAGAGVVHVAGLQPAPWGAQRHSNNRRPEVSA